MKMSIWIISEGVGSIGLLGDRGILDLPESPQIGDYINFELEEDSIVAQLVVVSREWWNREDYCLMLNCELASETSQKIFDNWMAKQGY